jgi:hypothetical protein
MTARAFLGKGDLYIARYVNGAFEDWKGPYECNKLEIKPNVELKEQVSKGKNTYGQVIESVALNKPADLTVELTEVNRESLAIALLGTTAALAQSSGTLTEEAIVAKLDAWVPLTKAALTGAQTVTNSDETTTYVAGVDYLVNKELGWIKALPGGAITASQALKVTSTYGAITGTEIKGATSADVRARFKLDGANQADGQPCIVSIHEVVIASDQAFDFLSENFAVVSMPGRMKTPVGFTEPFTVHLRDAAAA